MQQFDRLIQRAGPSERNPLQVRLELQADCYAGVWGHFAQRRNLLEPGTSRKALRGAARSATTRSCGARRATSCPTRSRTVRPSSGCTGSSAASKPAIRAGATRSPNGSPDGRPARRRRRCPWRNRRACRIPVARFLHPPRGPRGPAALLTAVNRHDRPARLDLPRHRSRRDRHGRAQGTLHHDIGLLSLFVILFIIGMASGCRGSSRPGCGRTRRRRERTPSRPARSPAEPGAGGDRPQIARNSRCRRGG